MPPPLFFTNNKVCWLGFHALQKQMLVVDELDITGGVLKIAGIDNHLVYNRGLEPFGQFSDTVGK